MTDKSKKGNPISRRGILPILGSSLLIPFLGFGKPDKEEAKNSNSDDEYQTMLKPDGTIVKVKMSALKKSNIVKENISNSSFLTWLGKKI